MNNLKEKKDKANELRKSGNLNKSLSMYRELWKESGDRFDGAGLLHCLRKLKLFDEAIVLADELINKYSDFKWCRIEVIWSYIEGILDKYNEKEPIENVLELAEKIMNLNPDHLALKKVVFKVVKSAIYNNNWEIADEWLDKIEPETLSDKPIQIDSGKEGWSDKSCWYNYKIKVLIKN